MRSGGGEQPAAAMARSGSPDARLGRSAATVRSRAGLVPASHLTFGTGWLVLAVVGTPRAFVPDPPVLFCRGVAKSRA